MKERLSNNGAKIEQTVQQPVTLQQGIEVVISNQQRHQENLQRLHGYFYKGTYYEHGIGRPHKKIKK